VGDVVDALPYGLKYVGLSGDVQQTLIGFRVLNNSLCFAIDGQYHGPFGLFQAPHEFARLSPEGGQRLNIFGNVEHRQSFPVSTFKGALFKADCKEENSFALGAYYRVSIFVGAVFMPVRY
jgi:hypothetical protein